jgi:phthalate 4,5-dioxygenase oxygenase subunit
MWVPVDDENTMFQFVRYQTDGRPIGEAERVVHDRWSGTTPGVDVDAAHRKTRVRENNWLQDRAAMRGGNWSGITGVQNQDFAVTESMGARYDRSKEHLGTSDVAVIRMRRLMLDSVRTFNTGGTPPLGLAQPFDYAQIRAVEGMIPIDAAWELVGRP